jgi:CdiI immunity protein
VTHMVEWQFPNLFQVFGGYLHQDWDIEAASWDEALRLAVAEAPEQAAAAAGEIEVLLASELDDDQLMKLIERLTTGYSPELGGWAARPWLRRAGELLTGGVRA